MFERPRTGERALLVCPEFGKPYDAAAIEEFRMLVQSAGAQEINFQHYSRAKPEPRYLLGRGKIDEIAQLVSSLDIELILFNHALSPSQERNIERTCQCRVLDRTGLILDIFAQRARSYEGKLQVELAQLKYLSTRLIRGWTHLERQKGGIGLRGPGETQLETDRRLLAQRVKHLEKRLQKVRQQREQSRQARKKNEVETVALVGYTNAGKSTLFNKLTEANVYQADQLFATLDPTLRKFALSKNLHIILIDTVGFIQNLPHDLIEAFYATLQETCEADLLLHVVDASSEQRNEHIEHVDAVLSQIGAGQVPQLLVYNKIDKTHQIPHIDMGHNNEISRVWISAREESGLQLIHSALVQIFDNTRKHITLKLPLEETNLRAELYKYDAVVNESFNADGCWKIEAALDRNAYERFLPYKLDSEGSIKENHEADFFAQSE